jgi:hypothetical protein
MLPLDVIRHIYSFGDPSHREQLKRVHRQLPTVLLSTVPNRYPYQKADELRYYGATTRVLLQEFYRLKRCQCCSRHAHNKPTIELNSHLVIRYPRHQVPECKDLYRCGCNCRHSCRVYAELLRQRTHLRVYCLEN